MNVNGTITTQIVKGTVRIQTMSGEIKYLGDVGPQGPPGTPGTTDFNELENKPVPLTNTEIENLLKGVII